MELSSGPKILIMIGAISIVVGLVWHFLGPLINIGKLPGDFSFESENVKVYFPLMSSLIISVVLSLVFWLFSKFGGNP